jgi:hypothetical protein
LNKGEVNQQIGNETRIAALILPDRITLELNICYFVQVLSRNIISISYLTLNEFKINIEGKCYSFYNNDIYYRSNIYTNNLYILDLEMSMFNTKSKRNILGNQHPSYSWLCKLDHINKTRITKLYKKKKIF